MTFSKKPPSFSNPSSAQGNFLILKIRLKKLKIVKIDQIVNFWTLSWGGASGLNTINKAWTSQRTSISRVRWGLLVKWNQKNALFFKSQAGSEQLNKCLNLLKMAKNCQNPPDCEIVITRSFSSGTNSAIKKSYTDSCFYGELYQYFQMYPHILEALSICWSTIRGSRVSQIWQKSEIITLKT